MSLDDDLPTASYPLGGDADELRAILGAHAGILTEIAAWKVGGGYRKKTLWDLLTGAEEALWYMAGRLLYHRSQVREVIDTQLATVRYEAEFWEREARALGYKNPYPGNGEV